MAKLLDIMVPNIGNYSMVNVAEICVKVGDLVKKEDSLITLETDKATMDVPSPFSGTIKEILVKSGSQIKEGDLIIRIDSADNVIIDTAITAEVDNIKKDANVDVKNTSKIDLPRQDNKNDQNNATTEKAVVTKAVEITKNINNTNTIDENKFAKAFASPSIRKLARELGADLGNIVGSGNKGRITESDVKDYVKGIISGSSPLTTAAGNSVGVLNLLPWPIVDFAQYGEIEAKPLSRIKKLSGANLARNWAMIPHVTQFDEADTTQLEEFRKQLNEEYKKSDIKITPLAFLIKACVYALKEFPEFNASLDNDNLVYKKYYNIGFAADTKQGLVVPVLKDADKKGVVQIANETSELAACARDGKLKPTDMQGGTFTISSLGGIGGTAFTPIINAPEVAILGISKSSIKPIWNGKEFVPKLILPLSLSYDHRIIDGALAAKFTSYLSKILSDVRRLIL